MRTAECVIVGGGPAGLAAARTAAQAGAEVVLIDENAELGGQYFRQTPPGVPAVARETADGRRLIDEVRRLGVEVRCGTMVWGIFDERVVALSTAEACERITARVLILAPGAYDRPVPFPGWTLPGVLTAGGAQNLMKGYGVVPGRRVAIAGSGPLLLAVAHSLLAGGTRIAAIAEASPMRGLWRHAHRVPGHLAVVRRGYRYWREIRAAGVPFLAGHVVRRADGADEIASATIGPCDATWRPRPGSLRRFDVDTLIVGYGFQPSLELARLCGAGHAYDGARGAWVPERSRDLESTVPGVFIVGDGAGVAGFAVALAEGEVAGLAAAQRLGRLTARADASRCARARRRLRHLSGFRRVLDDVYHFGDGVYELADDATTLCRCEELLVADARGAIADGACHVNEVKAWTRIGMGRCQGRMCGPALTHLVARQSGCTVAEAGTFTQRSPTKPVTLAALAADAGD